MKDTMGCIDDVCCMPCKLLQAFCDACTVVFCCPCRCCCGCPRTATEEERTYSDVVYYPLPSGPAYPPPGYTPSSSSGKV